MSTNDQTQEGIPPEEWIPHPISDHADYLDRPSPVYARDLTGDAKAEFEAAAPKAKPGERKPGGRRKRAPKPNPRKPKPDTPPE